MDGPTTPLTPPAPKRQKLVKDAAVFIKGEPTMAVNFPPFECNEASIHLSKDQKQELERKHREYEIFPSGKRDTGLIANYVRHIPYSSEKKKFFAQTGREAFDVFQYTFTVPGDPERRTHTVMWDYNVGLVRITPFFKACRYSKTTPAKALQTNPGLKNLSYSITGGALAAQGYWMPYQCARAICLTFCHPIRWALTPVFGPTFIKECLPQVHADFAKFKIDLTTTHMAALEAEGWR
ncbi:DNA-binding domain of Mlu1-box binding protein MBP1, partial [Polychaeton citri CBS 116435]